MQRPLQRVTLQPVVLHRPQCTSPIRVRAILAEFRREISEAPTQITDAINLSQIQPSPKITRKMLPVDDQGRPFIKIRSNDIDTLKLIEMVTKYFYQVERHFPFCIPLSTMRYLHLGAAMQFYWVPGTNEKIPYAYEEGNHDYDVMARG
jgi:hypothetical protein